MTEALRQLFEIWSGEQPTSIEALPGAGSARQYFRLRSASKSCIGVNSNNTIENEAFIRLATHFRAHAILVPTVYISSQDKECYLQEDLGTMSLYDLLPQGLDACLPWYTASLEALATMQWGALDELPWEVCYPASVFDTQQMRWDLDYFKYSFLLLAHVSFDPYALESDIQRLHQQLADCPATAFMHRDCQSRNIMIHDEKPFFIDFQGGRRGPALYDVASLLYQAKAAIPDAQKLALLHHYLQYCQQYFPTAFPNTREAVNQFHLLAFFRLLQVLGAYGLRGIHEKKSHFLQSIPLALDAAIGLLDTHLSNIPLPTIRKALEDARELFNANAIETEQKTSTTMQVKIQSFSYKRGLPKDETEHGGGFIFDCRFINNPGRNPEHKTLTGLDQPVQEFLQAQPEMQTFLAQVKAMLSPAIERYLERDFEYLSISFGCTGGQHRSVFSAEMVAAWLRESYPVSVTLSHRETEYWPSK